MFVRDYTLKLRAYILVILAPVLSGLGSCSEAEKTAPMEATASDSTSRAPVADSMNLPMPTEAFRGTFNEKPVLFSHTDFKSFTLDMDGQLTKGNMATEKGYGDDKSATVYILNSDKPKSEQKYFVRTPQGSVYMLDAERYVIDEAHFEPVQALAAGAITGKPEAAKTEEKKPAPTAEKKPAPEKKLAKKSSGKPSSVKSGKVKKKPAAKRIKKSVKKKKVVRKARKKNKKKKIVRKRSKSKNTEPPKPKE